MQVYRNGGNAMKKISFWLLIVLLVSLNIATESQNLLVNPSFEERIPSGMPLGWSAACDGGSTAMWDANAYKGSGAGKIIKVRDGISNVAALTQTVSTESNTRYTLSGFAFSQGVKNGVAVLFAYEFDVNENYLGLTNCAMVPINGGGYQPITTSLTTRPETKWLQVRFEIAQKTAEGQAWIDDVYLGQYSEAPAVIQNLIATKIGDSVRLIWETNGNTQRFLIFGGTSPNFVLTDGYLLGESSELFWQSNQFPAMSVPEGSLLEGIQPNRYYAVVATDEALNMSAPVYSQRMVFTQETKVVGWTIGTRKVKRDGWPSYLMAGPIKIFAARNEYEPFQVLVRPFSEPLINLTVTVSDLIVDGARIDKENIEVKVPHYIWLDKTYWSSNELSSTYNPGWYPDALIPIGALNNVTAPVDTNMPIWFTVYIPSNTNPGTYNGTITIRSQGLVVAELPLELEVWPVTLPVENHQETAFGLWLNQVAPAHNLSQTDPAFLPIAWNYYWYLVKHRINPRELPISPLSEEAVAVLQDPRITSFEIDWSEARYNPAFSQHVERLRQLGLLEKSFIYVMDEPSPDKYPIAYERGQHVHSFGTDVRVLVTIHPVSELYGEVDIWCPVLFNYDSPNAKARQSLGEVVWWYTCVVPKQPYPTYQMDDDAISHRILSWLQVKNVVDGTLYWSTTVFQKWNGTEYIARDVWTDPLSYPSANGEGFLLYPGTEYGIDGPIGTIRLEMIREGNEDLEYFWLLEDAARRYGLSEEDITVIVNDIVNPIAVELTDWKRDPELLYNQRSILMDYIYYFQSRLQ